MAGWTPPVVAWITRSTWATPNTYTLYDNDYRVEYIARAGAQSRTAPRNDEINQGNTLSDLTAFKALLEVSLRPNLNPSPDPTPDPNPTLTYPNPYPYPNPERGRAGGRGGRRCVLCNR